MRDQSKNVGFFDAQRLYRLRFILLWLSSILPLGFVLIIVGAQWPNYWLWINFERTPMTTLEVAVMFAIALLAMTIGARDWLLHGSRYRTWILLAAAFFWFALDDRFALHERLRDLVLAPVGISIPFLPWIAPGDFIVLAYAGIGLCVIPKIYHWTNGDRTARWRLIAAVFMSGIAVLLDTVNLAILSVSQQRLEQTVEECLELLGQVLFFQTFLCLFFQELAACIPHKAVSSIRTESYALR